MTTHNDLSTTQPLHRLILALEIAALVVIVLLAAHLRLTNIGDNPGWYTDEATHIDIAQHRLDGEVRYLVYNQSTLLAARLPLFGVVLAESMRVFGEGIQTARTVTALLGVLSVGLLWLTARLTLRDDRMVPLLAALALAIYPDAVLYSRIAFSYALLSPLILLVLLGLVRYWSGSRLWLVLAALSIGVGMLSDLLMGTLLAPLGLVVLARRPLDLGWVLPLAALPFGVYAAWMLATVPDAFLYDLPYTFGRLNTMTLPEQITNIAQNYTVLLSQGFWFPAGIIGVFLLRSPSLRVIAPLVLLLPLLILGRTVALFNLSFYYVTPFLPLIALGVGALMRYSAGYLAAIIDTRRLPDWGRTVATGGLAALLLGMPLLFSTSKLNEQVESRFVTAIDSFLLNPDEVREVVDYVNAQTSPDDVVLASVGVAWALEANAADFQMSAAYDGADTVHFPGDIPRERYAFNPTYTGARYIVIDNLWLNWGAVHMPTVARMVADVQANWHLELEVGSFKIYHNPLF